MDLLHHSAWLGGGRQQHADRWEGNRPLKKLRTTKSHAAILQPVARFVRDPFDGIGSIAESLGYGWDFGKKHEEQSAEQQQRQVQLANLQLAQTYEEWRSAACKLDRLEGNVEWKTEDRSTDYDFELVRARLQSLEDAHAREDLEMMRFYIRTSLTRDLGGMGDVALYKHCRVGTKALIERYIQIVVNVLDAVVEASGYGPNAALEARLMNEQMKQARQAFGRSALLLSGGGTLGMNHIGVVKALFEAGLLPRIISGASAGSIVCSVLCSKTDEEIPEVLLEFCSGDLAVFESETGGRGLFARALRFLRTGAIYDIENLRRVMRNILGDMTFQEAYNRTQRILSICVSSSDNYEVPKLLNYVTAPNVLIWSAVCASCSVPLIFPPSPLMVKDPRTDEARPWDESPRKWIDGSVDNDLPMERLAEMLNVNHFIVSQVNPHVVPFLSKEGDEVKPEVLGASSAIEPGPSWMNTMANLAKGEALHRLHVLAELGIFPDKMTKLRSVLGQRYSGDITIVPEVSYADFPNILSNPNPDFMLQAMSNGERATWPKISRIQNHLTIELALDRAVHKLMARAAFTPSQIDMRMNLIVRPSHLERRRRRGSRASQNSARTSIIPHEIRNPQFGHRSARSLLDPPSIMPTMPSAHAPSSSAIQLFSSMDDTRSTHSSQSTSDSGEENDSDNDVSESTFDSPPSPQPNRWSPPRQYSISQPTTPSMASRSFVVDPISSFSTRPPTPGPFVGLQKMSSVPSGSTRLNAAETKHKSNVLGVKPMSTIHSRSSTPQVVESPEPKAEPERLPRLSRRLSALGLHLDVSAGTKRKKHRFSTGLKALKSPPTMK